MPPDEFLKTDYADALEDFQSARRKAVIGELLARVTGKTSRMIPYDEVKRRMGGIESARRQLKEIPLDAIVGTVGRYNDFNRKLLPLSANDSDRWARVRQAVETQLGLPPIEVYQVGLVYFILDGHHRASVARDFGSTHIQAYVREVYTRVPLAPDDQPDDIIIKSEYADFLDLTHIDEIRPGSDLRVSVPGGAEKLSEHISVHRYYMGIDENRPVGYPEAVAHWYDRVYSPVAQVIRLRMVLKDFPGRTEADLYLWIMEHRSSLEESLGWKVSPLTAAMDLISHSSPTLSHHLRRALNGFLRAITPDPLEPSPPPGEWRRKHAPVNDESAQVLFGSILVAVSGDASGWNAVDQAALIARDENAVLGGYHIQDSDSDGDVVKITGEFQLRCEAQAVQGALVVQKTSAISRAICEKSFWADLLVLRLSYPPPFLSFRRFGSGLRNIIRLCQIPIILVPPTAGVPFKRVLLAYGGGPKADEALFIAAYMAKRWGIELVIVAVSRGGQLNNSLADRALTYLKNQNVQPANTICETGDPADAILSACTSNACDMILMGGYEGSYLREMVFGSTVDRVLWGTKVSVMLCS